MWVRFPLPRLATLHTEPMDAAQLSELYIYLCENVRMLDTARRAVRRDINTHIQRDDTPQIDIRTKLFALLYSTWSEAHFAQVVHTPNAFPITEIARIKAEKDKLGISHAWNFMLERAVARVGDPATNRDLRKKLATLHELVSEYVKTPALIRNKVAHGQWSTALNRGQTAKNDSLTQQIAALDPIAIDKQFKVHEYMGLIVRDLVESPRKAFHREYWVHYTNLEDYLKRSRSWTLASKRTQLYSRRRRIT